MNTRDRMALSISPLLLRVALGVTFIWAGSGKVFQDISVQGATAALLANMGAGISPGKKTEMPIVVPPSAAQPPATPSTTSPPTMAPPTKPLPPGEKPKGGSAGAPSNKPVGKSASTGGLILALAQTTTSPIPAAQGATGAAAAPRVFTEADFPEAVTVKAACGLALMMYNGAHPGVDSAGKPKMALWPARLAQGSWPIYLAWAVAFTELIGGALVLLGMFTRLGGLGLAGVMLGALWLSEIGPAIQSGSTLLGFLPAYPTFSVEHWSRPLWQFMLMMGALALVFSGSGAVSVDGTLFSSSGLSKSGGSSGGGGSGS